MGIDCGFNEIWENSKDNSIIKDGNIYTIKKNLTLEYISICDNETIIIDNNVILKLNNSTCNNYGKLCNYGTIIIGSIKDIGKQYFLNNYGAIHNYNNISIYKGELHNSGRITNHDDATILNRDELINDSIFTNNGVIINHKNNGNIACSKEINGNNIKNNGSIESKCNSKKKKSYIWAFNNTTGCKYKCYN